MKKIVALVLAALMLLPLVACGGSKTMDASPAEIEAAIAKALGDGYLCTVDVTGDDLATSVVSDVDMSQVEEFVVKTTAVPAMNLDRVAILKCKDGYADQAVEALNAAFANTISYIRLYPFGTAKVEGARLYKVGNTVIYVLAGQQPDYEMSDEDAAKLAAAEYEKVDAAIKGLAGSVPENLAVIPKA